MDKYNFNYNYYWYEFVIRVLMYNKINKFVYMFIVFYGLIFSFWIYFHWFCFVHRKKWKGMKNNNCNVTRQINGSRARITSSICIYVTCDFWYSDRQYPLNYVLISIISIILPIRFSGKLDLLTLVILL